MKVKDLIKQLIEFEQESEIVVYDDDNDRTLHIVCVDADKCDEQDDDGSVLIIAN